jgi:hypothetical protein
VPFAPFDFSCCMSVLFLVLNIGFDFLRNRFSTSKIPQRFLIL